MNDDDDGGRADEVAQPSFNDNLNIIAAAGDFSAATTVSCGTAEMVSAAAAVDVSPAAVSLHTPTPPDVDDVDEAMPPFSFDLQAAAAAPLHLTHYDLPPPSSPTTVAPSSEYDNSATHCISSYSY